MIASPRSGRSPITRLAVIIAAAVLCVARTSLAQLAQDALRPSASGAAPTLPYYVGQGRPTEGFRASDPELATWALRAWAGAMGRDVRLVPVAEEAALIRVYWAGPRGGQYGEMRPLVVGDRSGAAVYIRPDMSALGDEISRRAEQDALLRDSIVYLTCVHEIGHAFGLPHTAGFSDIMYSFQFGGDIVRYFDRYRQQVRRRADIGSASGLSDADTRALRTRFAIP